MLTSTESEFLSCIYETSVCLQLIEGPGPMLQFCVDLLSSPLCRGLLGIQSLSLGCLVCVHSQHWCFFSPAFCGKPANAVFCKPPALSGRYGRHSSQRLCVICAVQRLKQVRGCETSSTLCCVAECTSLNFPTFPDSQWSIYTWDPQPRLTVICRRYNHVPWHTELWPLMPFVHESRPEQAKYTCSSWLKDSFHIPWLGWVHSNINNCMFQLRL